MKKHFFIKRKFIFRIALVIVLSFVMQGFGNIVEGQEMKGITGITKGSVDLTIPPDPFLGKPCHYTIGWSIQIAPRKAALICGRFISGTGNIDFIDGADLIIFDDLANISSDKVIPLTRNISLPGDSTFIRRAFPIGGFVPFGAKQKDG